jgi:hypothetical protein
MAHLPASKAREGFADTINRVAFGKERVVLRRRGRRSPPWSRSTIYDP